MTRCKFIYPSISFSVDKLFFHRSMESTLNSDFIITYNQWVILVLGLTPLIYGKKSLSTEKLIEGYMNLQRVTNPCLFFRGKRVYESVDQAHKRIVRVYYSPLFFTVYIIFRKCSWLLKKPNENFSHSPRFVSTSAPNFEKRGWLNQYSYIEYSIFSV